MTSKTVSVVITGAAGRISYSLIPLICDGSVFGKDVRIDLRLLDVELASQKLEGLAMEIQDSCYELLDDIQATTNQEQAFKDVQVAVILGGYPRLAGMERRDLITKNAEGMNSQAKALSKFASPDVKVLVVANPANTNTLVAMRCAGRIPIKNFTCLTRLDHERLRGMVLQQYNSTNKVKLSPSHIQNLAIFGNHSATQVPFIDNCKIISKDGNVVQLNDVLPYSNEEFASLAKNVQTRGAAIINTLQASSALSAANAIAKHLQNWLIGPKENEDAIFSMGVISNGNTYGVPDGLVFSFPCKKVQNESSKFLDGEYEIVEGYSISQRTQELLNVTIEELKAELKDAEIITGPIHIHI